MPYDPFSPYAPTPYPVPSPQDEENWLLKLGRTALAPLQWLGESLDKFGATSRGLLAGRPDQLLNLIPFSDTLGITNPEHRTTGRDLNKMLGIDDGEDSWTNTLLGMATEVATDPLNLLHPFMPTAMGSSLAKMGQKFGWARNADIMASDLAKLPAAARPILETGGAGATDLARDVLGGAGRLHAGKLNVIPDTTLLSDLGLEGAGRTVGDQLVADTGRLPKTLAKVTEFTQPLDQFSRLADEPLQIWERLPLRQPSSLEDAVAALERGELVQPGAYRRMAGDLPDAVRPGTVFVEPSGRGALLEGKQVADELYKTMGLTSPWFLPGKLFEDIPFNLRQVPGVTSLEQAARGLGSAVGKAASPIASLLEQYFPNAVAMAKAAPATTMDAATRLGKALFGEKYLGQTSGTLQKGIEEFGQPAREAYGQEANRLIRQSQEAIEPLLQANPGQEIPLLKGIREAAETGHLPPGAGLEPPFSPLAPLLPPRPPSDAPLSVLAKYNEDLKAYQQAQRLTAERNPLLSPARYPDEILEPPSPLPKTRPLLPEQAVAAPDIQALADNLGIKPAEVRDLPMTPTVTPASAVSETPAFLRPTEESLLERIAPPTKYGRKTELGGEALQGAGGREYDEAGNLISSSATPRPVAQGAAEKSLSLRPSQLADDDLARRVLKHEAEQQRAQASWAKMQEPGSQQIIEEVFHENAGLYQHNKDFQAAVNRELSDRFGMDFQLQAREPLPHLWPQKDRGGLIEALYRDAVQQGEPAGEETLQRVLGAIKSVQGQSYEEAAQRIAQAGGPALTGAQLQQIERQWASQPREGKSLGRDALQNMSKEEKAQARAVANLEKASFYENLPEGLRVPRTPEEVAAGSLGKNQQLVHDELLALRKQKPDTSKILDAYHQEFTRKISVDEATQHPSLRDTGFDQEEVKQFASIPPEDLPAVLQEVGVKNPQQVAQTLSRVELPQASTLTEAAAKFPGDAIAATERHEARQAFDRFVQDLSATHEGPGSIVPPPAGTPPTPGVPGQPSPSTGQGIPGVSEAASKLRQLHDLGLREMEDLGLNRDIMGQLNLYNPRAMAFEDERLLSDASKKVARNINSAIERESHLKELPRGTESFDRWVKDPNLSGVDRFMDDAHVENFLFKDMHDAWAKAQRTLPEIVAPSDDALRQQAKLLSRDLKQMPKEFVDHKLDFYRADPIADSARASRKISDLISVGQASLGGAAQQAKPLSGWGDMDPARLVSLEQFLADSGRTFNRVDETGNIVGGARHKLAQMLGTTPSQLGDYYIPKEIAKELNVRVTPFVMPEAATPIFQMYDQYTGAFKTWVTLLRPAFYTRNLMDAAWRMWRDEIPLSEGWAAAQKAWQAVKGKAPEELRPFIREAVENRVAFNPHVTNNAEFLATSHVAPANLEAFTPREVAKLQDIVSGMQADGTRLRPAWKDVERQITEAFPDRTAQALDAARSWQNRQLRPSPLGLNPERQGLASESGMMGKVKQFNQDMEDWMRFTHYLAKRQMGFAPDAAAAAVKKYHFDYGELTDFERNVMKRIFPFYTFSSKSAPSILADLATNPGRVATTVRVANTGREQGYVPDWLGGSAIPIPGAAEGQQRFLSSLGLPIDDVAFNATARLLSGQPSNAVRELLGATNPLAKGLIELGTGKSLYSDRNLADAKPSPLLSPFGPAQGNYLQTLLSMTPLTGPVNQLNQLVAAPDKGLAPTAVNLLTGLKVADVDTQKAQEMAAQRIVRDLLTSSGTAKQFTSVYVPQEQRADLSSQEQEMLGLLDVLNKRRQIAALEARAKAGDMDSRAKLERMRGSETWAAAFR